jgi:DNA-binding response OmpR family regulator
VGALELDLLTRAARHRGEEVHLSATEFELLAFLMRQPGQVLSRQRLLKAVWGYDFEPQTNVVQVYIGYLRRKLGRDGGPTPIETVRSAGYRLRTDG